MFTTKRLFAFLGIAFFLGYATAGDSTIEQVFNDGTRIEYNAAGDPVRFTDTAGKVFVNGRAQSMEQVFDDGTRIVYNAAGTPVRFTDTSGAALVAKR